MRYGFIEKVIGMLALGCFLLSLAHVASTAALAQGQVSERDCRTKLATYIREKRLKPSREAYSRAMAYCKKGDMRTAQALLAGQNRPSGRPSVEERCLTELREYARAKRLTPSRDAYRKAVALCKRGDMRQAQALLASQDRPSGRPSVEERCLTELREYARAKRLTPSWDAYRKAVALCKRGDMRQAQVVLAGRNRPSGRPSVEERGRPGTPEPAKFQG